MLLDNVDCFRLAKTRQHKGLSLFQKKELMSSFYNNCELTEDVMISLSQRLRVTQGQVKHFFQTRSKKIRNVRRIQNSCK